MFQEELTAAPRQGILSTGTGGYAGSEFCDGNVVLLDMLNRLTRTYSEEQLRRLTDILSPVPGMNFRFGKWPGT